MDKGPGWTGIYVPALTMFGSDGALDEEATRRYVDRLIEEGCDGIVAAGSSGEFTSLTDEERRLVIAWTIEAARGRVPVIAGTGHVSTRETIRLGEFAASVGAAGAIVILPYYEHPSHDEVVQHFRAVGAASPIPVMIYNNPFNSGAPPLDAEDVRGLYESGYVAAIKSTFPTVHQVQELRAILDDGFRVFYGSFMSPLEGFAAGAHGWISGILNVMTPEATRLRACVESGDLPGARLVARDILAIRQLFTGRLLGSASDLAIYRAILRLQGSEAGYCRAPFIDLPDDTLPLLATLLPPGRLSVRSTPNVSPAGLSV